MLHDSVTESRYVVQIAKISKQTKTKNVNKLNEKRQIFILIFEAGNYLRMREGNTIFFFAKEVIFTN